MGGGSWGMTLAHPPINTLPGTSKLPHYQTVSLVPFFDTFGYSLIIVCSSDNQIMIIFCERVW